MPLPAAHTFGSVGQSPGQFGFPRVLDADDDSLWVVDKLARVQRLDPTTGACLTWWRMPQWENGKPTGATSWGHGDKEVLFVADTHYHRVMVYGVGSVANSKGSTPGSAPPLVTSFGEYGKGPGQFIFPTDIAVLPTDDGQGIRRLYVSEFGENDRVSIWEPTSAGTYEWKSSFGTWGTGENPKAIEFNRAQSVVIDLAHQRLIVSDACNHRLGVFTLNGELQKWIGSPGHAPGELQYPYGLTWLEDGTLLVAELGNHRVQRFDVDSGKGLGSWGAPGSGPGELAQPWAVARRGRTVYVLDSGNNRVQSFDLPG